MNAVTSILDHLLLSTWVLTHDGVAWCLGDQEPEVHKDLGYLGEGDALILGPVWIGCCCCHLAAESWAGLGE